MYFRGFRWEQVLSSYKKVHLDSIIAIKRKLNMIANKHLSILIMAICIVAVCEGNYYSDYLRSHYDDYTKRLSSYIRTVGEFVVPYYSNNDKLQDKSLPLDTDNVHYKQIGDDDRKCDAESCYIELHKCWSMKSTDISDDMMSRRIVNMLLTRAKVREEGSINRRYIVMETSDSELQALTKFGRGELKLREIDPILSNAIKKPESNGFIDYAFMLYTWLTRLVNYIVDQKYIVISIVVLVALGNTLNTIRWNFWNIFFSSIHVLLSTSFLISWWKVLQNDEVKGTASEDSNLPIQCQPDKMLWTDKAWTWFYHYDCEKQNKDEKRPFLNEDEPDDAFIDDITHALIETLVLSGQFVRWVSHFVNNLLSQMLPGIILIIFLVGGLLFLYVFLTSLYEHIKDLRKTYSMLGNNISDSFKNSLNPISVTKTAKSKQLNFPPRRNKIKSINKNPISGNNAYYRISCATSLIIKTNAIGAKVLDTSELESKINTILGKIMEVERILGRIVVGGKEQITVVMKRKEDKKELIERWQEMKDNGLFVKEDVILLDEIGRWNILGLSNDKWLREQVREIRINKEFWIWDEKTREWVQREVARKSLNNKDNNKQVEQ